LPNDGAKTEPAPSLVEGGAAPKQTEMVTPENLTKPSLKSEPLEKHKVNCRTRRTSNVEELEDRQDPHALHHGGSHPMVDLMTARGMAACWVILDL
jgi:hypothetical protein